MNLLRTLWSELIGLFVDDGSFAIAILVWLGICRLLLPHLAAEPLWPPLILFAGLVLILVESAARRARQG